MVGPLSSFRCDSGMRLSLESRARQGSEGAAMGRRFSMHRGTTKVVFGAGASAKLAEEIDALGFARVVLVSTPSRKEEVAALAAGLGRKNAGILAIAREHVPRAVVAEARPVVAKSGADAIVAFGGGSAIGLAKALALEESVRIAAIPTTYSGSE